MKSLTYVVQVPVTSVSLDGTADDGGTVEQFETADSVARRRVRRVLVEADESRALIWNGPGRCRDCAHCVSLMRGR